MICSSLNRPFFHPFILSKILMDFGPLSGEQVKESKDRVRFILTDKVLCCFSKEATNPLLWAHYSECHRGICLGFEISPSVASSVKPITYVDKRYTPFKSKTAQMLLNSCSQNFQSGNTKLRFVRFFPDRVLQRLGK